MENWRKNTTSDGPDIWVYGDGKGKVLYRMYEIFEEENIDGVPPKVVFTGDSEMTDPTIDEIIALIESREIFGDNLVLCRVKSNGNSSERHTMKMKNGKCYWRV